MRSPVSASELSPRPRRRIASEPRPARSHAVVCPCQQPLPGFFCDSRRRASPWIFLEVSLQATGHKRGRGCMSVLTEWRSAHSPRTRGGRPDKWFCVPADRASVRRRFAGQTSSGHFRPIRPMKLAVSALRPFSANSYKISSPHLCRYLVQDDPLTSTT